MRGLLAGLGLAAAVELGEEPRLVAVLATPRGNIELRS